MLSPAYRKDVENELYQESFLLTISATIFCRMCGMFLCLEHMQGKGYIGH